jgi:hypothetical protein
MANGERVPFSFLFLFLGATPCTEWLDDVVAHDDKGFVLTGADRRGRLARDERALRGGRRPVGLGQALRDRRR